MEDRPAIVPRRVRFDLSRVPKYWHSESPFLTYFFMSLSIVFPEGERFFIDSVRRYEDRITDPRTRAEVRAFIRQEARICQIAPQFERLATRLLGSVC